MNSTEFFTKSGAADTFYRFDQADDPKATMARGLANMILKIKPDGFSRNDHILVDIGCAYGKSLFSMVEILGFKKAVGIDISEEMLRLLNQKTKQKFKKLELRTFCLNLEKQKIPLPDRSISV